MGLWGYGLEHSRHGHSLSKGGELVTMSYTHKQVEFVCMCVHYMYMESCPTNTSRWRPSVHTYIATRACRHALAVWLLATVTTVTVLIHMLKHSIILLVVLYYVRIETSMLVHTAVTYPWSIDYSKVMYIITSPLYHSSPPSLSLPLPPSLSLPPSPSLPLPPPSPSLSLPPSLSLYTARYSTS